MTDNGRDPAASLGSVTVRRFRKRPVVIEAMIYDGSKESFVAIWEWMERATGDDNGGPNQGYTGTEKNPGKFGILTLEGKIFASPGDVIIRGVKGEFYPCKPDIFSATYEPER
jgi:hypothetical protein